MRFSVLSSGSKANSTFIDTGNARILIDCGLSAKQLEIRLNQLGVNPASIDAILVTHEHSDHIHGVPTLSKRYKIPVFANFQTLKQIPKSFHFEQFQNGVDFWVGATRITPFSITHDAVDPVGFSLFSEGLKFSQATDLGRVTLLVTEHLKDSNFIVLESNHDQEMLRNCEYPWELKSRISSSYGHLSNDDSTALLKEIAHSDLRHVVLGHLSEHSNTPSLALQTHLTNFDSETLKDLPFQLQCGSVHQATPFLGVDQLCLQLLAS
jgi:phosphoribosyl 1,2-cyclic phosphodiesterase